MLWVREKDASGSRMDIDSSRPRGDVAKLSCGPVAESTPLKLNTRGDCAFLILPSAYIDDTLAGHLVFAVRIPEVALRLSFWVLRCGYDGVSRSLVTESFQQEHYDL